MEDNNKGFCLEVWGDFACFTRPEFKVERVSYPVITPSAARAIFEAIFWKPAIKWIVTRIEVLNPICWTSVRRNEVGATAGKTPIYIEEKRQQKNTLMLKDVRYRIWATMKYLKPEERKNCKDKPDADESPGKYLAMFERRASKGQHFTHPYFGCREFAAHYCLVNPGDETLPPPIKDSQDLQFILYDMDFEGNKEKPDPIFFNAIMNNGVIDVPMPNSNKLIK
jgi:CRISPR-associated protein Cas5d